MWGPYHSYLLKFVPCVHLSFLIFAPSELISANTKNLILMNYKIKKKKNQSHILNKNHYRFYFIKN